MACSLALLPWQARPRSNVGSCARALHRRWGPKNAPRSLPDDDSSRGNRGSEASTSSAGPSLSEGVNVYCTWALGLLFLTDLTPLGSAMASSPSPLLALTAAQWGLFVVPTMWNSFQQKEDLRAVYRLKGCGAGEITRSAAIGVALWGALQVAETARQGFAGGGQSLVAIPTDAAGAVLTGSSLPSLLLCAGLLGPLAEELLFRGYLLTALQTRLGKWDGAVVSGFTFALLHLDPASFLRFTLLGTAGALAAWETGSVLPALAVHAGHNLAAIASLAAVQ